MNTNVFFENVLKLLNKIANNGGGGGEIPANVATKEDTDAIKQSVDNVSNQIGEVNSMLDNINGETI